MIKFIINSYSLHELGIHFNFLFQAVPHSQLFDHMAFEHNFSVGKPDNLVYINDLLNLLEEKLEKMVRNKVKLFILFTNILKLVTEGRY